MKYISLGLLIALTCSPANAALVWMNGLTIKSYKLYWDGSSTILTVSFKDEGWIPTGCTATDNSKSMSHWNTNAPNSLVTAFHATIIAAEMTGRKINVQYENGVCHQIGRSFNGIELVPEN